MLPVSRALAGPHPDANPCQGWDVSLYVSLRRREEWVVSRVRVEDHPHPWVSEAEAGIVPDPDLLVRKLVFCVFCVSWVFSNEARSAAPHCFLIRLVSQHGKLNRPGVITDPPDGDMDWAGLFQAQDFPALEVQKGLQFTCDLGNAELAGDIGIGMEYDKAILGRCSQSKMIDAGNADCFALEIFLDSCQVDGDLTLSGMEGDSFLAGIGQPGQGQGITTHQQDTQSRDECRRPGQET